MIAFIVMISTLVALAGVVAYFLYDYSRHKEENDKGFLETAGRLDTEKKDRLSNIKFVVDQVNDVNTEIYDTMTSNVKNIRAETTKVADTQQKMLGGIDKFLRFSSNISLGESKTVSLLDLPGTTAPNVELMQRVTAVMGMTASDLVVCNKDKTRCSRFEDKNGDLYLIPFQNGKRLVVDSSMNVNGEVHINGTQKILGVPNGMVMQANSVGVGPQGFSDPKASLHVQSVPGQPSFKISNATSDALLVSADGELVTTQSITFRKNVNDPYNVATLSVHGDGELQISAPNITLNGMVNVTGNMKVDGTISSQSA